METLGEQLEQIAKIAIIAKFMGQVIWQFALCGYCELCKRSYIPTYTGN